MAVTRAYLPPPSDGPKPYTAIDANDQLVWTLDESTTIWANTGGAGALNLTPHSAGPVPSPYGLYNNAAYLPGPNNSTQYLDSGATTLGEFASAISLSCFLKPNSFSVSGGNGNQLILHKAYRPDGSGWANPYFSIALTMEQPGTDILTGYVTVAGTRHAITCHGLFLRYWNHVGLTYDGTTLRLYCNGGLGATGVFAGIVDYGTHGPWNVGGDIGGSETQVGSYIDDVRIANVVRPDSYFYTLGYPLSLQPRGGTVRLYQNAPPLEQPRGGTVRQYSNALPLEQPRATAGDQRAQITPQGIRAKVHLGIIGG